MNHLAAKFRRGDPHPEKPGLFYWGKILKRGVRRIQWLSAEKLASYRTNQMRLVKLWQANNPEKSKAANRRMKAKRKDRDRVLLKAWKKRNRARWSALKLRHQKKRRSIDMLYLAIQRCRARIRCALKAKGWKKNSVTFQMLGCTPDQFRAHIESRFVDGMCWGRLREIHIDHIIPVSSARTKHDLVKLFHYTNLQPLWGPDNLAKGAKLPIEISA